MNYQELPSTTTQVQRVVFDDAASQWAPVTSGVQQGTLLGPLLFTIFFNDLPNASERIVTTALYVDYTKIFNCIGSEEDYKTFQTTLSNMEHWSKENNFCFNAFQCKTLSVVRKKKPLCYSYNLDGVQLERVIEGKDLRVIITNSLSWDTKRGFYTLVPSHRFLSKVKRQVNLKSKQVSCEETTKLPSYLSLFWTGYSANVKIKN